MSKAIPNKMKALVKSRPEPGLWLEDVPTPEIGINDVLIRVHRASICGTDLHILKWDAWASKTIPVPMVVGHASHFRMCRPEPGLSSCWEWLCSFVPSETIA